VGGHNEDGEQNIKCINISCRYHNDIQKALIVLEIVQESIKKMLGEL